MQSINNLIMCIALVLCEINLSALSISAYNRNTHDDTDCNTYLVIH